MDHVHRVGITFSLSSRRIIGSEAITALGGLFNYLFLCRFLWLLVDDSKKNFFLLLLLSCWNDAQFCTGLCFFSHPKMSKITDPSMDIMAMGILDLPRYCVLLFHSFFPNSIWNENSI